MKIVLIIASYSVIIILETLFNYNNFSKKEYIYYISTISVSVFLSIVLVLEIKIPSPTDYIRSFIFYILGKR